MKAFLCLSIPLFSFSLVFASGCAQKSAGNSGPELAPPSESQNTAETLDRVAEDYWNVLMERYPTWATSVGEHRYDDRLLDTSYAAEEAFRVKCETLLARAKAINVTNDNRLSRDLLIATLEDKLLAASLNFSEIDIDQLSGPQAQLPYFFTVEHPMKTKHDVENLIARYHAVPGHLRGIQEHLERGLEKGVVVPKVVATRVLSQFDALLAKRESESPFIKAAQRVPDEIEGAEDYRELIKVAARAHVIQAFTTHRDFLREYLPKSRESVGLSQMKNGANAYSYLVKRHTTTTMTPEEIHALGVRELERIYGEMRAIQAEQKEEGTLQDYLDRMRKEPAQVAESREALLKTFQDALKRADAALPSAFGRLPKLGYSVKPMDASREKDAPAAYYQPGAPSDGREGVFVANLYPFKERPLFNSAVLAFHEAVPGHHLQIAISQELEGLPTFRKETGATAFIEGWGLYSEKLSDELGLYVTPEERIGYLGFAAWRAKRLVVDTGLHHMGWSRQKAIDFFMENATLGQTDVENEIDRYIVMPGQALAYMVGCLEILSLRESVKKAQGDAFDLRAFHDAVLSEGALPLPLLEASVLRKLRISPLR